MKKASERCNPFYQRRIIKYEEVMLVYLTRKERFNEVHRMYREEWTAIPIADNVNEQLIDYTRMSPLNESLENPEAGSTSHAPEIFLLSNYEDDDDDSGFCCPCCLPR